MPVKLGEFPRRHALVVVALGTAWQRNARE